jgi:CelD/BcsL family acetyltransferase involved in cellulose biosynthesis
VGIKEAVQITVLRDPAELAPLTPEWEELAASAIEPNPVYEPWMLLPALGAFAKGQDLRIVVARHGGELAGLFPLQVEPRYKGLPLRTLTSWMHPHCMLCVPLVRANRAHDVLKAVLQWARSEGSLLELSYLAAEGAFHQTLVDVLNEEDHASLTTDAYTRALLCRATDADTYFKTCMAGDERRQLRRLEKRLGEVGKVEHLVLRKGEELPRWIDEFLTLEASGWKGKRGSALACSEENQRFARRLFTGAFERGRLLMVGINLDGKPIARYCGLVAGEGAIAFKTAFDESLRKYGPGTLAVADMIGLFHEQPGLQWMDSYTGPGNEMIAALWKHRRTVQRVALATDAWGEAALAVVPLMRCLKRFAGKLRGRKATTRTFPSLRPA